MRRKNKSNMQALGLVAILVCTVITVVFIWGLTALISPSGQSSEGTSGTSGSTSSTGNTSQTSASTQQTSASTQQTSASTQQKPVTPTKKVALTFDDGPHNVYSKAIANELAKYGFHATFFAVGNRIDGVEYNGSKTISYLIANGHEIGIHGYTHRVHYDSCTDAKYAEELNKTLAAIHAVSPNYKVNLMRPIGGAITDKRASECDYSVILWDVDSEDYKYKYESGDSEYEKRQKAEAIANNVISAVKDGSIILMHDIYESTFDAVKIILEQLAAQGYEVVTVSELIGDPEPGTTYYSYYNKKEN